MFFQSTADSYVCPALGTRRQQLFFPTEKLSTMLSEKAFLQMVMRAALVVLIVVLAAQIWMGYSDSDINESLSMNEQERHVLIDKNIALRAKKAYLLSPQRIEKLAAERLALFVAAGKQIRYVN